MIANINNYTQHCNRILRVMRLQTIRINFTFTNPVRGGRRIRGNHLPGIGHRGPAPPFVRLAAVSRARSIYRSKRFDAPAPDDDLIWSAIGPAAVAAAAAGFRVSPPPRPRVTSAKDYKDCVCVRMYHPTATATATVAVVRDIGKRR